MRTRVILAAVAVLGLALGPKGRAAEPLRVLIIDGQNNHNWKAMTPPMKADLEKTGRFAIDVATTPPKGASAGAWSDFRPDFSKYDVVLSNYNGEPWPEAVREALEAYVAGGGGLAIIHAANNAFESWPEYNTMIGLGWRKADFGDRITIDEAGKVVRSGKGEGPGSGHGPPHAFAVDVRDPEHPITRGMPTSWMHARDELYHGQRGPAKNMHVILSAFSAKDKGGTGTNEPIAWVVPYGKGRVFTCVLGHVMGDDVGAIQCVGFKALVARGTEWAATGKVTVPLPRNFPTARETRSEP